MDAKALEQRSSASPSPKAPSEVDMKPLGIALLLIVVQTAVAGQQSPGDPNSDRDVRQQTERYFAAIDRATSRRSTICWSRSFWRAIRAASPMQRPPS